MFLQEDFTGKQKKILFYILLILVFFWHLPVMKVFLPGEDSLDPSWVKTLQYAAENHISFGKGFIFTYGPLGYLFNPMTKEAYFLACFFEFLFLFALKDLFLFRNKREFLWKTVLVILTVPAALHDLFLLFFPPVILGRTGEKPGKNNIFFMLYCTFTGAICVFMKFTFFPVILLSLVFADIRMVLKYKRCFLLAAFLLFLPLIWLLAGQQMGEYINFFLYSFEIMDGFNKAMSSFYADIKYFFLTLAITLFLWGNFLFLLWRKKELSLYEKILYLFAFSLPLYVSYKYAVVRMDAGHIAGGLLNLAAVAAYLFCKNMPEKVIDGELLRRAFLFAVAVGIPILIMTKQLPDFHRELGRRITLQNLIPLFQKQLLPQKDTAGVYQGKSCDLFCYGEFDFLHKTGFKYLPRPVMQTYSAYTEKLLALNRNYTSSAPTDFLLFRLENLDNRFPMLADYSILPLCGKYVSEKLLDGSRGKLLLMKKDPAGKKNKLEKICEKTFSPGEKILLPDHKNKLLYASFSMEYSFLGKLVSLLWRVPPPVIHITTANGNSYEKDLIAAMAEDPFLFSPYLEKTEEFAALWDGENGGAATEEKRIVSFHISFTGRLSSNRPNALDKIAGSLLFRKKMRLVLYEADMP